MNESVFCGAIKAFLCFPSELLFMTLFSPSEYESKLWKLSGNVDLEKELPYIKDCPCTSRHFEKVLDRILESENYSNAVDQELIRNQPLRYIRNKTDSFTFYSVAVATGFGFSKLPKRLKSLYLILNFGNFMYLLGGHKF